MKTTDAERASGIYPESAKQEWLDGPSSPQVILQLRDMLTRSSKALQAMIEDRNCLKVTLEEIRDTSYTSRAEVREVARQALLPKGHHDRPD